MGYMLLIPYMVRSSGAGRALSPHTEVLHPTSKRPDMPDTEAVSNSPNARFQSAAATATTATTATVVGRVLFLFSFKLRGDVTQPAGLLPRSRGATIVHECHGGLCLCMSCGILLLCCPGAKEA